MGNAKPELRAEAIRLRVEERRSLNEIAALTGAAKSSLSIWLRPYPLTVDEKRCRLNTSGLVVNPRKDRGQESKFHRRVADCQLTRHRKGKIAEAAVLFRLVLEDFTVFGSMFDGDKADWFVEVAETGKRLKIQVRWVKRMAHGLPIVTLICYEGHSVRRSYKEEECDFLVGYDLFSDTAYVYSYAEIAHLKTGISVSLEHAERWDKLRL
ncbi:MAG: group I intron-associated PD-(D/E)XK endonuclease [Armatimonadota bacterium]|nr:group I intron-associated PD-(D/E)XK endonuclease [Armatimonadota bacterium]